jgi:hypothetical protein
MLITVSTRNNFHFSMLLVSIVGRWLFSLLCVIRHHGLHKYKRPISLRFGNPLPPPKAWFFFLGGRCPVSGRSAAGNFGKDAQLLQLNFFHSPMHLPHALGSLDLLFCDPDIDWKEPRVRSQPVDTILTPTTCSGPPLRSCQMPGERPESWKAMQKS